MVALPGQIFKITSRCVHVITTIAQKIHDSEEFNDEHNFDIDGLFDSGGNWINHIRMALQRKQPASEMADDFWPDFKHV